MSEKILHYVLNDGDDGDDGDDSAQLISIPAYLLTRKPNGQLQNRY